MVKYYNKIPKRFEDASFEKSTFGPQFSPAIEYVNNLDKQQGNLILQGGCGIGKTHFAYCVVRKFSTYREKWSSGQFCGLHESEKVLYVTIKEIIDDIRRRFRGEEQYYDYSKVPLLIVEEVGVQYGTDSERVELYQVFNQRWEDLLPTICISNLKKTSSEKKPSLDKILGARICDRLFDKAVYLEISGGSLRKESETHCG